PTGRSTGASTSWTGASFARTSTPLVQGGAPDSEALGRSRGGFSTKVHLKADGAGQPLTVVLTPGQQHESTVLDRLLRLGAIRRPGPGRPRLRPDRVVGDKG